MYSHRILRSVTYILTLESVFIHVIIFVEQILTDSRALVIIAERSKSSFHQTGHSEVQFGRTVVCVLRSYATGAARLMLQKVRFGRS